MAVRPIVAPYNCDIFQNYIKIISTFDVVIFLQQCPVVALLKNIYCQVGMDTAAVWYQAVCKIGRNSESLSPGTLPFFVINGDGI